MWWPKSPLHSVSLTFESDVSSLVQAKPPAAPCVRQRNRSPQLWRAGSLLWLNHFTVILQKAGCSAKKLSVWAADFARYFSKCYWSCTPRTAPSSSPLPYPRSQLWLRATLQAAHLSIFTRPVTRCTFLLGKTRSKPQLCPFLTRFFLQELVLVTRTSRGLGTPCPGVRG